MLVDHFERWIAANKASAPQSVNLPGGTSFLLFACWFDGSKARLCSRLAQAIQTRPFPFDYCHWFPNRTMRRFGPSLSLQLRWYFHAFGLKTAFAYQGYPATASVIAKALRLRAAFVPLMKCVEANPDAGYVRAQLQDFLEKYRRALD